MDYNAPDLTQHPPRSARVRIGGYVILARALDKGRAAVAGKNGEYNFDCPVDRRLFEFAGIDGAGLRAQIEAGKTDGQILAWIQETGTPHAEWEIEAWSAHQERRTPCDPDGRDYFNSSHRKYGPEREDIRTWFDLLDLDDFVSFGGKA